MSSSAEKPFSVLPMLSEHLEIESECPYGCPLCSAMSMIRKMNPEVSAHLSAALTEMILAAKAFIDGTRNEGTNDSNGT